MNKNPEGKLPLSAAAMARKAASMPWKENARVDISPYEKAILALRERGYSYGEVAIWLGEQLNAPVNRGQVYYVCQMHAAERNEEFLQAEREGRLKTLPNLDLTAEDAERAALEHDRAIEKQSKKPRKKK